MFGWSQSFAHFSVKHHGPVLVLHVHGPEIRHPTPAAELKADVLSLLEKDGHKALVLDLTNVRYMSSTGFAVLLSLAEKVKAAGGQFKICSMSPDVAVGANIIGLGRLIDTYEDVSAAVESF